MKLLVEILGWTAFVLNLLGNELLGKKKTIGWPVRLVANAAWLFYSLGVFAWPLFVNHVVFSVSNARGWWQWRREDKKDWCASGLPAPPLECECAGCKSNEGGGT